MTGSLSKSLLLHACLVIFAYFGMEGRIYKDPKHLEMEVIIDGLANAKEGEVMKSAQTAKQKHKLDVKKRKGDMRFHKKLAEHSVPHKAKHNNYDLQEAKSDTTIVRVEQPKQNSDIKKETSVVVRKKPSLTNQEMGFTQRHIVRSKPNVTRLLMNLQKTASDLQAGKTVDHGENKEKESDVAQGEQLSIIEVNIVRAQISKCWKLPTGAIYSQNVVVTLDMELDREGRVIKAQDIGEKQANKGYKIAAESAVRAVLDPQCNPIKLPAQRYHVWREMTLKFNPKDFF